MVCAWSGPGVMAPPLCLVLVLVRAKPLSGYMVLVPGIALLFQVEHGKAFLGL